jgi:hypothetical protein
MHRAMRGLAAVLLVAASMAGCGAMKSRSSVILPNSAYFVADPGELKALQAL